MQMASSSGATSNAAYAAGIEPCMIDERFLTAGLADFRPGSSEGVVLS